MRTSAKPLWLSMNARRYSADQVLRALDVSRPPVNVERIAVALGAEVSFVAGAEWDGQLQSKKTGSAFIIVNKNQAPTRLRFTIAHEIGHLILHEPGRNFRDKWSRQGTDVAEIQANNFAANLLMPSWMVNAYASRRSAIADLASLFNVSQEAMRYRLEKLGYRIA